MPQTEKVLGQAAPVATVLTNLYIVPTATRAVVSTITVCNRSNTTDIFRVLVAVNNTALDDKQYIYYDVSIPGKETFAATVGLTLSVNDVVKCYSLNGDCSFNLFGVERT
jgi:hypothetical protein